MSSGEQRRSETYKDRQKTDYDSQKVPVFIINLPKSTDRKAFMKAQCEEVNISPIFIDAVYGKDLSKSDIEKYCDQEKVKKLFGRELLLGEIGCALSHKKIYQKIVDENISYAIILEDDAILEKNILKVVKIIMSASLPWDLILLGHYKNNKKGLKSPISLWNRNSINSDYILGRLADFGFGAHGYMITLEGAKKILIELDEINRPLDHYTPDSNILNVYALYPTIINVESDFETLIDNNCVREQVIESKLVSLANIERKLVSLAKSLRLIDKAVSFKSFLKTVKPIKRYK